MSTDQPRSSSGSADPSSLISAARAQVEAARAREQRSGRRQSLPVLPRYTFVRELHRGGQGIVYLAIQESTGREVAIKILSRGSPASSAERLARFEREVESLSLLKHPNIVTIHDCGRDQDHVYLVMNYVRGRPLDEYVKAEKIPVLETVELFAKVCDGVAAAHLRGIIHRDLKPGNILVDSRGEPHIVDFGLAKPTISTPGQSTAMAMTETGQFIGSLLWASPEQAEGRSDTLDIRTDVYSLGVVLYHALTGAFPYPVTGNIVEVVKRIVQMPPALPVSARAGEIDRELATILLKCLAKEPERRYQSAGELARDLRRYLAGDPIDARRESLMYMMGKRLERYRLAAIASAAVLLLLTGALVTSISLWRRADHQRVLAHQSAQAAQDAARRADRNASEARAVVDFMREVLTSIDPEQLGADVRLIEILARAADTAPERFSSSPAQEAEVRELLGQSYYKLGMWQESKTQFALSVELWRRSAGPDDPRTLKTQCALVRSLFDAAGADEAERVLNDLLPRIARTLDPADPVALDAQRCLAIVHLLRGRVDEAEALLLQLRVHPHIANDDEALVPILGGLVAVYQRRMNVDDAVRRAEILVAAESVAQEWVERSTRSVGPGATTTLFATVRWADLARNLQRYRESGEACRRILDRPAERLGECHIIRATAMYILADTLVASASPGADQEAADLYLRSIECFRRQYPVGSPQTLAIVADALRYLERAGRAVEGEALARELATALGSFGGGHGDFSFTPNLFIAAFVSMQGRFDEAEARFLPLLAANDQQPDARTRARTHLMYGSHLTRRGRFEEAESQLRLAAAGVDDFTRGTWDTHPDDIVLAFTGLYKAWGRPDLAAEYERMRGR